MTVVRHGFIERVVIWGVIETSNSFPYLWTVGIAIKLCRKSFQPLVLASLMASFPSRQASIHSCRFWWIVWWRRFRLRIFAWTCGLIQGFGFLLSLVLPTWSEAVDLLMLLKRKMRIGMFGSSENCYIRDSTLLVREDQSTPLKCHLAFLGITGLLSDSVVDENCNW